MGVVKAAGPADGQLQTKEFGKATDTSVIVGSGKKWTPATKIQDSGNEKRAIDVPGYVKVVSKYNIPGGSGPKDEDRSMYNVPDVFQNGGEVFSKDHGKKSVLIMDTRPRLTNEIIGTPIVIQASQEALRIEWIQTTPISRVKDAFELRLRLMMAYGRRTCY